MVLEKCLFKAHSLSERYDFYNSSNFESAAYSSEIANYWRAQNPFSDRPGLFKLRLEQERLTEQLFDIITSDQTLIDKELPHQSEWVNFFFAAINTSPEASCELPEITDSAIRTGDFLRLIKPFLSLGYQQLSELVSTAIKKYSLGLHINKEKICEQLYQELAARCAMICSRAMVLELQIAKLEGGLEGATKEERFEHFVRDLENVSRRGQLLSDYPVMTRLVVDTILNWKFSSHLVIQRLCNDWHKLSEIFSNGHLGSLHDIKTSVGDTHKNGQTVSILTFSSDIKIVYKPRSVAIEKEFAVLTEWFNRKGFIPKLKTLNVFDQKDYGWVEFAAPACAGSTEGVERFYKRQGGLLALLYALEANDFHYENIIANGEHPILVDLETLFHPWVDDLHNTEKENAPASVLKKTVLSTGLLPRRIWTQQGETSGVDLSGFTEVQDQMTPTPVLEIENSNTDEMVFVRKKVPFSGASNMPKLGDSKVRSVDYNKEVQAGFKLLYKIILENKEEFLSKSGPLTAFEDIETRVIFRETRSYASFLLESLHPDFLGDALERDIFFDQLWIATEDKPYLSSLIKFEQKALRKMDIPMFTTKACSWDLYTDDGFVIKNFFEESGLERVKKKVSTLNEDDLTRQLWVINASLLSSDLSNKDATHSPIVKKSTDTKSIAPILNAISDIGDTIERLAFRSNGGANWFTWKSVGNSHWDLEAMDATLYDGLSGMALFLAYAGEITEDKRYRKLAEEALATARFLWRNHQQDITDIGLFSGWGGLIYTLCHLSAIWEQPSLLEEASELQVFIENGISTDQNNDITGGCAGAISALLLLNSMRPDPSTINLAISCGEQLLSKKVPIENGAGWILDAAGGKALAGMSHGAAGICAALAELYHHTNIEAFKIACDEAIQFERGLYSENMMNWPDLRAGKRPESSTEENGYYFMTAWCHGAPGIGLARIRLKSLLNTEAFDDEISDSIHTTMKSGFLDNHCLCHGSLGNLDLLLQAAKFPEYLHLKEKTLELAAQIVAGQSKTGWLSGYMYNLETPGFMVGFAGIGYQLLRVLKPNEVPSVLSFEAPYK